MHQNGCYGFPLSQEHPCGQGPETECQTRPQLEGDEYAASLLIFPQGSDNLII
jgi:hypothetical protein